MSIINVPTRYAIAFEGVLTKDRRILQMGSLWWENLPLPVLLPQDQGTYETRVVVGKIVKLERIGPVVWATVEFDEGITEDGKLPPGYILSLDGMDGKWDLGDPVDLSLPRTSDAYLELLNSGIIPPIRCISMRVAGCTLIPEDRWAWKR